MKNWNKLSIIGICCFVFFGSMPVSAQDKMALTITPPIIKNNVNPGQIWKSYIKVVNNNDKDIDAYVQLMDFDSDGETGTVKLSQVDSESESDNELSMSNWVIMEKGPINVSANKSTEIPFIVDVPDNIDPGDHHIAILVGTKPNNDSSEGSSIKIASMLGSLLLLNVNGDVIESGEIREFSKDRNVYSNGDVKFVLRFQNTGSTILQPQGEIKIIDFKGNEKGNVKINQKTNTGNVFPDDIRRWEYAWPVPTSIMEMGRYKADISLIFGNNVKETKEQTIYFWVIQWKPLLIAFGTFLFIILLIITMVRRYVRSAIEMTQEQMGMKNNDYAEPRPRSKPSDGIHAVVDLKRPVKAQQAQAAEPARKKKIKKRKRGFMFYSTYVIVAALLISFCIFVFLYISTKEDVAVPIKEVSELHQ